MSVPSVSMIVPAFNAAEYVVEAVESLLAQDCPDLEIIVVDDGSTDGTGNLVTGFGDRVILHRQTNAGQSAALTTGWAMARGEYFGYLSADDRLRPQAVRRCAEELAARPDVVLVYPDFGIIDEHSVHQATVCPPDFSRCALYAQLHCLPGPGALFKRDAYERTGPWRPDLRQVPDLDFFLRLALEGDFHHLPEVLADFRRHSGSTTYTAVAFERGEEPLRMLESLYSMPNLPEDVRGWKRRAQANALMLSSAIHARSDRPLLASRRLVAAGLANPTAIGPRKMMHGAVEIAHALLGKVRS